MSSRTTALAASVIRQAMDDIEMYLRMLARGRIRIEDIGTAKHKKHLEDKAGTGLTLIHRNAIEACGFLVGDDAHAEIASLWYAAAGIDFQNARDKAKSMYPIAELMAM